MIMQIFYHPELEDTILHSFQHLVTLLSEDQIRSILLAENAYSLRPVEFAAQHGSCHMVMAIMDIPGVYLYREERHGLTTYQWYDVTDYEASAERFAKSPLLMLTFVDAKAVDSNGFKHLHSESLVWNWFDAKFKTNIPFILMLFTFRVLYIICYFVRDMDTSFYGNYVHGNTTKRCRPGFALVLSDAADGFLAGVLLLCSIFTVVIDVAEIILHNKRKYWHINNTVEGKKKWLLQVLFYKYCNLLFSVFVFFNTLLGLLNCYRCSVFFAVARVMCPVMAVWNILYFIQLLPSIGGFVIAIQTILEDLRNFSIVYIIFMIPFMHSFQTFINTNTNVGCMESFDDMFRIVYSLFITMLNMIDYTKYNVRNAEVLLVAHMAFTFVVSIMMINFFIALLSNSVNRVGVCKLTVRCIQRCSVAMLQERRCFWIFKPLYLKLKQRYFQFEDGRYFIVRIKPVLQDDYKNSSCSSPSPSSSSSYLQDN